MGVGRKEEMKAKRAKFVGRERLHKYKASEKSNVYIPAAQQSF